MTVSEVVVREDRRREISLGVLVAADVSGYKGREALKMFDRFLVREDSTEIPNDELFRVRQFEDDLPTREEWEAHRAGVTKLVLTVDEHREQIDNAISAASPRWRLERMPVIDRNLLRIGVTELRHFDTPRPRATLNGLIELAKRYGAPETPSFINGILDQIRRDLGIPFA